MPADSAAQYRQQKDKTMRRTLEHTLDVIGEFGIEGVTTKRISERMNMSTGILHHHFGTKDNMVYEAYVSFVEDIRLQTLEIMSSDADPEAKLTEMARILFDDLHSTPAGANLWLNFWHRSFEDARVRRLLSIYHKRLISNMTHLFHRIYRDRSWARFSARRYFTMIQGNWISLVLTGVTESREQSIRLLQKELTNIINNSVEKTI